MLIDDKIQKDVSLAPFTTFKIGGPARYYIEAKTKQDLVEAVAWAKENDQNVYYLGGGSNLLIADEGLPGLVIRFGNREVNNMSPRFHCGAGASLAYVITQTRAAGLTGLEWAFGIPMATVGGSIRGNAGAFGQSMGEAVETVEFYNVEKERFEFFSQKDCQFSYRSSIFKQNPSFLVWNATLKLKAAPAQEISDLIEKNLKSREAGQPRLPNAGCVFKNLFLDDIAKVNPSLSEHIKEQNMSKGGKVGAGYLVDLRGLKGKAVGGAKVSLEHANFIVNTGRATAKDVLDLVDLIKKEIKLRFSVDLEEEIVLMK
jgi:UDP-N-acetylmuramate dehydrogenase